MLVNYSIIESCGSEKWMSVEDEKMKPIKIIPTSSSLKHTITWCTSMWWQQKKMMKCVESEWNVIFYLSMHARSIIRDHENKRQANSMKTIKNYYSVLPFISFTITSCWSRKSFSFRFATHPGRLSEQCAQIQKTFML